MADEERQKFCERVASDKYVADSIERFGGAFMDLGIFRSLGEVRRQEVLEQARGSLEKLRQRIDEFLS